jgi:hypothetical protein
MMILKKAYYMLKETILIIMSKGNSMSDGAHVIEA